MFRLELWTVSPFVNGWQVQMATPSRFSRSCTDEARKDALARWSRSAEIRGPEIANLRQGLKAGYSAPKGNVRIVIDLMTKPDRTPTAESPFDSPSVRDKTPRVRQAVRPAGARADRSGVHALTRDFPPCGVTCRPRASDRRVGQPERRGVLRASVRITAHCRRRRPRARDSVCARSSISTRR